MRLLRGLVAALAVSAAVPPMAGGAAASLAAQAPTAPAVTRADVQFMRDMIEHHRQAIELTSLIPTRTRRPDIRLLGQRITVSQADEIALMERWLRRHAPATAADSTHAAMSHDDAGHGMAGMLTAAQMRAIRAARGPSFDRLFLDGMLQHHGGALRMVQALLAMPGAAQESAINRFVTDVDADQRAEMARMRLLQRVR